MKKWFQYIIPVMALMLMAYAYEDLRSESEMPVVFVPDRPAPKPAVYPRLEDSAGLAQEQVRVPFVGKDFVGFKEALAYNESGGRYHVVNSLGFMGKYQFGRTTLKELRIDGRRFLKDPRLQEEAFRRYVARNRKILAKEIRRYAGKRIHGILITESGILAAAHLAGAGAVKKYLHSYGKVSARDAYGTRIEDYLRRFGGYDLSGLEEARR
ncbi:MAG: hypothetical protein GXO24_03545 [Chlorobi bacterium]|nr:hypothetical protein [Chlorobiota bacterium]